MIKGPAIKSEVSQTHPDDKPIYYVLDADRHFVCKCHRESIADDIIAALSREYAPRKEPQAIDDKLDALINGIQQDYEQRCKFHYEDGLHVRMWSAISALLSRLDREGGK